MIVGLTVCMTDCKTGAFCLWLKIVLTRSFFFSVYEVVDGYYVTRGSVLVSLEAIIEPYRHTSGSQFVVFKINFSWLWVSLTSVTSTNTAFMYSIHKMKKLF
jgi:hypothetical protein